MCGTAYLENDVSLSIAARTAVNVTAIPKEISVWFLYIILRETQVQGSVHYWINPGYGLPQYTVKKPYNGFLLV